MARTETLFPEMFEDLIRGDTDHETLIQRRLFARMKGLYFAKGKRGRPEALTPEQIGEAIFETRENSTPAGELAERFGVTKKTILNSLQRRGEKPNPHGRPRKRTK